MVRPYSDTVQRLSELLEFAEKHCAAYDTALFRGQQADWPLLPKIARLKPRSGNGILSMESEMLASIKLRALPYLDRNPETDWEWLSIAQHHGMATRLLDWTTNPLAALWFAVGKPPVDGKDGVIWMLAPTDDDYVDSPIDISPFKAGRTRVFQPKHVTRRIVAQHGWFTVHNYPLSGKGRFVTLESNARYKNRLMKIRIPPDAFAPLRVELDRCGVNAATLYGDMIGLCQDIEWQHCILADEEAE